MQPTGESAVSAAMNEKDGFQDEWHKIEYSDSIRWVSFGVLGPNPEAVIRDYNRTLLSVWAHADFWSKQKIV